MIAHTDYGSQFTLVQKLAFFRETSHAYGRTALLLSGGSSMGMYHLVSLFLLHQKRFSSDLFWIDQGVVKALYEANLLPRIWSGSSAGAIVASLVCSRPDEQLPDLFSSENLRLEPFQRLEPGSLRRRIRRLLTQGIIPFVLFT